jgi:hypothetical protein
MAFDQFNSIKHKNENDRGQSNHKGGFSSEIGTGCFLLETSMTL